MTTEKNRVVHCVQRQSLVLTTKPPTKALLRRCEPRIYPLSDVLRHENAKRRKHIPHRGSNEWGNNKCRHRDCPLLGPPYISNHSAPNAHPWTSEYARKKSTNDQGWKCLCQTGTQDEECITWYTCPIYDSATKSLTTWGGNDGAKGIA